MVKYRSATSTEIYRRKRILTDKTETLGYKVNVVSIASCIFHPIRAVDFITLCDRIYCNGILLGVKSRGTVQYKSSTVSHSKWKDLGDMKKGKMFKSKMIVFILLASAFTASIAYCQKKVENRQTIALYGTVTKVDAVGNIIEVKTNEGQQMAFSVPDDVSITEGTEKIGLMDIEQGDSVAIQYYSPSPGEFVAVSITYNKNS